MNFIKKIVILSIIFIAFIGVFVRNCYFLLQNHQIASKFVLTLSTDDQTAKTFRVYRKSLRGVESDIQPYQKWQVFTEDEVWFSSLLIEGFKNDLLKITNAEVRTGDKHYNFNQNFIKQNLVFIYSNTNRNLGVYQFKIPRIVNNYQTILPKILKIQTIMNYPGDLLLLGLAFVKTILNISLYFIIALILLAVKFYKNRIKIFKDFRKNLKSVHIILCVLIILSIIYILIKSDSFCNELFYDNTKAVIHWKDSMETRWLQEWKMGPTITYADFVNQYTPTDAVLVKPGAETALIMGNYALFRYFVFPRKIQSDFNNADYACLFYSDGFAVGSVSKGWPKVYVPAEKIIYWDSITGEVSEVNGDYDPKDIRNQKAFGLIVLKKRK